MTIPLAAALQAARVYDLEQQRLRGMPIHRAHPPGYFYGMHSRHRDTYRQAEYVPRSSAAGVRETAIAPLRR